MKASAIAALAMFCSLGDAASRVGATGRSPAPAEPPKSFRVSAVQENRVWIEGGLLDGLQEGIEGEIYYEISVLGQKRRIVPARVRLLNIQDRQCIGTLRDQVGIINVGYHASLPPRPIQDLLTSFHGRGIEAFTSKDFLLARQFYQRILEALPGDPFAMQGIQDCDAALAKQAELAHERRNVPYYKQVVRSYLESKDHAHLADANSYIEKILAVFPVDEEANLLREQLRALKAPVKAAQQSATKPAGTQAAPLETKTTLRAEGASSTPADSLPARQRPGSAPTGAEDMMYVPGGEVTMGATEDSTAFWNETPRHKLQIAPFYIDRYEVTNADYKRFCHATGRTPPSYFVNGDYPAGWGRRPIVMISWIDADAYARWAGKRLPAEFEWEMAAAGVEGRVWPWGDKWDPTRANTREGGEKEPTEVGSHPADVSPYKVYDMAGNVSEWTADWYKAYPKNSHREKEYGEQFKVLRGGSVQVSKQFARAQFRARLPDGFRSMDLGFRCALSVKTAEKSAPSEPRP